MKGSTLLVHRASLCVEGRPGTLTVSRHVRLRFLSENTARVLDPFTTKDCLDRPRVIAVSRKFRLLQRKSINGAIIVTAVHSRLTAIPQESGVSVKKDRGLGRVYRIDGPFEMHLVGA